MVALGNLVEWLRACWFIVVPIGAGMIWILRWLRRHAKDHEHIEAHIMNGRVDVEQNTQEHKDINAKLDATTLGVRELLVHFDINKPGTSLDDG